MGVPFPTVMKIGHWADARSLLTHDACDTDAMMVSELFRRSDALPRTTGGTSSPAGCCFYHRAASSWQAQVTGEA